MRKIKFSNINFIKPVGYNNKGAMKHCQGVLKREFTISEDDMKILNKLIKKLKSKEKLSTDRLVRLVDLDKFLETVEVFTLYDGKEVKFIYKGYEVNFKC